MMRPEPELEAEGAAESAAEAVADLAVPGADFGGQEGAAEPATEPAVGAWVPEGARETGDMAVVMFGSIGWVCIAEGAVVQKTKSITDRGCLRKPEAGGAWYRGSGLLRSI